MRRLESAVGASGGNHAVLLIRVDGHGGEAA
jgi:hypothetical protein